MVALFVSKFFKAIPPVMIDFLFTLSIISEDKKKG